MEGRVVVDLLKVVQKDFNLVSYKLDYVAETFIKDKIKTIEGSRLTVNGLQALAQGNYISITLGKDSNYKVKKFQILEYNAKKTGLKSMQLELKTHKRHSGKKPKWTLAKDDVSPKEFSSFKWFR